MRKPLCKPARRITLELEADKAEQRFKRTRSHKARVAMEMARQKALAG